ncbi:MAG: mechanosensitive ion channel [Lachnospiraceae bacterium]|nr:mechanosensitive ion channel [Lachnospiraceae bacterium]
MTVISQIQEYILDKVPAFAQVGVRILIACLVYWIGSKLIKWSCKIFRAFLDRKDIDVSAVRFLTSMARAVLYFLLIVTIAMQLGLKEASVAAVIASMGVGLSLALQGGMANLAGGMLILILKPFSLGDYIIESVGKYEGTVKKIDMFYTTVSTVDNRLVIIPNGQLTNNSIINVTAQDKRQLEIKVGISYDDDIRRAKSIIEELLKKQEYIMSDQDMSIFVDELGESSVVIGLRAWVPTDKYWKTKWEMNEKIKLAFDEAGITIPYNQLEVHVNQ